MKWMERIVSAMAERAQGSEKGVEMCLQQVEQWEWNKY